LQHKKSVLEEVCIECREKEDEGSRAKEADSKDT